MKEKELNLTQKNDDLNGQNGRFGNKTALSEDELSEVNGGAHGGPTAESVTFDVGLGTFVYKQLAGQGVALKNQFEVKKHGAVFLPHIGLYVPCYCLSGNNSEEWYTKYHYKQGKFYFREESKVLNVGSIKVIAAK